MRKYLAVIASLAFIGCGGGSEEASSGDLDVTIVGPGGSFETSNTLREALISGDPDAMSKIKSVWFKCRGDDRPVSVYTGSFPISYTRTKMVAGDYICQADAFTGTHYQEGDKLFTATGQVTVVDRKISKLNLVLQPVGDPGSVDVPAPQITAISIDNPKPVIYKPVHLIATVTASPSPVYSWSVACVSGQNPCSASFSKPSALETDFTSMTEGDLKVTFTVTDPSIPGAGGSITSKIEFLMHYLPQGIDAQIGINSYPNITSITATPNAEPLPLGKVNVVAVASDPDGDKFTSMWTDDCGGSFSAMTLSTVWTAPNKPGAVCTLKLSLQEAGNADPAHNVGHNEGTFTLKVAPSI